LWQATVVAIELFGAQGLVLGTDDGYVDGNSGPSAFDNESDVVGLVVDAPSSQVSCLREAR
jgi:hypothetical protein